MVYMVGGTIWTALKRLELADSRLCNNLSRRSCLEVIIIRVTIGAVYGLGHNTSASDITIQYNIIAFAIDDLKSSTDTNSKGRGMSEVRTENATSLNQNTYLKIWVTC